MPDIDVQKEIEFLRSEVFELRRNQSSRRGLTGERGPKGDTGSQGPMVSTALATSPNS